MRFSTFWGLGPLRRSSLDILAPRRCVSPHSGAQGLSDAAFLDILGPKASKTLRFSIFWRLGPLRRCVSRHSGAQGLSEAAFLDILAESCKDTGETWRRSAGDPPPPSRFKAKASQTQRFPTFWRPWPRHSDGKCPKCSRKHAGDLPATRHSRAASEPRPLRRNASQHSGAQGLSDAVFLDIRPERRKNAR